MYTSIRCPNNRPHNKYSLCGRLLGLVKNGEFYLYCEDCKEFFKINVMENDTVEMTPISKNNRLILKTGLRAILK